MPEADRNPETDEVQLELVSAGLKLDRWLDYAFNSHFLTPTDGWSFSLAADAMKTEDRAKIQPGAEVRLTLNQRLQGCGFIDSVEYDVSREGGLIMRIEGRDKLAQVVDSCADPTMQFKAEQSLQDVLTQVFETFGFSKFDFDNNANRNIISGQTRGTKRTKRGKLPKDTKIHQLKPYFGEGAFAFVSRICQRHGLWIWLGADGETIIVGEPNFDTAYTFDLFRQRDGKANILHGSVRRDVSDQPSVIVAEGFSGSPEFGRSRTRCIAVSTVVTDVDIKPILAKYPDAKLAEIEGLQVKPIPSPRSRPVYLHDEESKTIEQLERFVKRELALRTHKAFSARYTIPGHSQNGVNWAVDSLAQVRDDAADVDMLMWILSRTFRKSRTAGTTTDLELILPYSIQF